MFNQKENLTNIDTWWTLAKQDHSATFYQTPAWFEVAQCFDVKYEDKSLFGTLENGTEYVFPLTSYARQWPFNRLYSVFDHGYGGVVANGPISAADYQAILQRLPITPFTSFYLTEPPSVPPKQPLSSFETGTFTSSLLSLENKTFEEVVANYSRTHRSNYRKGIKHGIKVRKANLDDLDNDFDIFYELYLDTYENRWTDGQIGNIWSREFFKNFAQVMKKYPEHIYLWFAELEGEAISAEIDFVWNNRLDSWATVSKPAHFKIKPTIALLSGIIQHALEIGVTTFDFGPNLGKQGLEDFKRRFGAETTYYETWEKPSPILNLIDKLRS